MKLEYCVIIPAHNEERFIIEAIRSVFAQSLLPSEVVVIDDGSSDNTAEVAEAAGARVIRQSNSCGPSASRNHAIAGTTSPLVAFLDADDEWMRNHAQTLADKFNDDRVVFAGSRAELFGAASGPVPSLLTVEGVMDLRDVLIADNPIVQSAVMVRRSALTAAGGYSEGMRLSEDYDLWTRVGELGSFSFVNAISVRRRVHASQVSSRFGAGLAVAAWGVRQRALQRRFRGVSAAERNAILELLHRAAQQDIEWAVGTGKRSNLAVVRAQLAAADASLGLSGSLASIGGEGALSRRISQDFRNAGRSVLARLRPSNAAS